MPPMTRRACFARAVTASAIRHSVGGALRDHVAQRVERLSVADGSWIVICEPVPELGGMFGDRAVVGDRCPGRGRCR